jgi:hypothetical protein
MRKHICAWTDIRDVNLRLNIYSEGRRERGEREARGRRERGERGERERERERKRWVKRKLTRVSQPFCRRRH